MVVIDFRQRQDNFCLLRNVWTGSRAHPLSYSMDTGKGGEGFTVLNVLVTTDNYCSWSQYKHKQKCHKTIYLLCYHYSISHRASRDEAALGSR
jgi:hypothetical protein